MKNLCLKIKGHLKICKGNYQTFLKDFDESYVSIFLKLKTNFHRTFQSFEKEQITFIAKLLK